MTSLADDLETAIKAALPEVNVLPHLGANAPDHRWLDVCWDRFAISVLAPVTNYGIAQGYLLYTYNEVVDPKPEVFHDVAPLLARITEVIGSI
jgi:hypothetical protein